MNTDIESVKVQRAEMWREIQRLKELADQKTSEAAHQSDKMNQLNANIAHVQARIEDLNRLIEARNHDLHEKMHALEETQRELARTRDHNSKLANENAANRRDHDRLQAECHDAHKELQNTEGRNTDLSHSIRDIESKLTSLEEHLHGCRRDIDIQRTAN